MRRPKNARQVHLSDELGQLLRDEFPTKYVLIHTIFLALFATSMIVLQIILMANDAHVSMAGNGIWSGFLNFIIVLTNSMLSKIIFKIKIRFFPYFMLE